MVFLNLKYKESIINKIKGFLENFIIDLKNSILKMWYGANV